MNENRTEQLDVVRDICQAIVDKKGMNTVALDVTDICSMTDFFIIAEGTVERHIHALADSIREVCKKYSRRAKHQAGESGGEWIVLDFHDIIVHLLTPEMRLKYSLEEVWNAGKIVSVPLEYGRNNEAKSIRS